jgi:AraC-like DNA-binding protein
MLLPSVIAGARGAPLPQWPPLLATRGPGALSELHRHHASHFVVALAGSLKVRTIARGTWREAAGVLTAADCEHAVDARGVETLLVFLDPESDMGAGVSRLAGGAVRLLSASERDHLVRGADPRVIVGAGGADWLSHALACLGGAARPARVVHPRVKKLLRRLNAGLAGKTSLESLAAEVGVSPGRLMHAFTESVGIPLRPYLAWLRLQRAAVAIVSGMPLAAAAQAAGFADSAHMARTFRRMFGVPPSALRPREGSQLVQER